MPRKKPPTKQKYIPTPELMREYFNKYRDELKDNPFLVHDFVGKDAESVERRKEKPLTMEGFGDWLDENNIITDVSDYFENKEGRYNSYVQVCRAIKRKIRKEQIEGGMAGIYNPSITQRLNNIYDKVETGFTDKDGNDILMDIHIGATKISHD